MEGFGQKVTCGREREQGSDGRPIRSHITPNERIRKGRNTHRISYNLHLDGGNSNSYTSALTVNLISTSSIAILPQINPNKWSKSK